MSDEIHKATEQAKQELLRATEGARDELLKATEELGKAVAAMGTVGHGGTQNPWDGTLGEDGEFMAESGAYLYTAVLARQLSTMHPRTLARSHVRDSQVLIDKDPQVSTNHLDALSKWELVAKANEVVEKMVGKVSQGPTDPRAVGAKRLCNGGVVYEFDTPETATWLCKEKAAFTESFGGMSVVKVKAVMVLIEYIPVTHTPDALSENRKIKQDSKLKVDMLLAMRCIKPKHKGGRSVHGTYSFQK